HEVARDGHHAGGAVHEPGEVEGVVAGVELQAGAAHAVEAGCNVSGGVLDGLDLRQFGEPVEAGVADGHAGAPGDVVDHRGQRGRGDDVTDVAVDALLGGPVVVRGDHEQA